MTGCHPAYQVPIERESKLLKGKRKEKSTSGSLNDFKFPKGERRRKGKKGVCKTITSSRPGWR